MRCPGENSDTFACAFSTECNPEPANSSDAGVFKCDKALVGLTPTHCVCATPGSDCGCANMKHRCENTSNYHHNLI